MKSKRLKSARKTLHFYKQFFNLKPPYTAVLDGTFAKAALRYKVNICEQLPKYLDSEVRLCTTRCVLKECEAMGSLLYGPLKVLRQYDVLPCLHKHPVKPGNCLLKYAEKEGDKKYFLATQDEVLSDKIRAIPGTPLLFISHSNLLVEAPSGTSKAHAEQKEMEQLKPTNPELEALKQLKREVFGEEDTDVKVKKKRKGPKGANPLSCKKKKVKPATANAVSNEEADKPKRRRKRHKKTKDSATVVST